MDAAASSGLFMGRYSRFLSPLFRGEFKDRRREERSSRPTVKGRSGRGALP